MLPQSFHHQLFLDFMILYHGQGLTALEPAKALLMTAAGSMANRKVLAEISLELTTLQSIQSTFSTKNALSKILHAFSCIYC